MENIEKKRKKHKKKITNNDDMKPIIDTCVLSGGSIKGIAYIGVLKALDDKHILKNIKTFAGTSIGGIVSALYIIGYTYEELMEFIILLDLKKLKCVKPEIFLDHFGIDDWSNMEIVMNKMFKLKNIDTNITFLDLYKKTNIKLILTTVCINEKKLYYLSHETYPNMPVILGLRMTSSVPFWFVPVTYENKLFIDGGIMNNYPIELFNDKLDSVIGCYLSENIQVIPEINDIETLFKCIIYCVIKGFTQTLLNKSQNRTIKLILPCINLLNLDITKDLKEDLFQIGYNETIKFLDIIK